MRLAVAVLLVVAPRLGIADSLVYQQKMARIAAARAGDPATVVARFAKECATSVKGDACVTVRRELEAVFLQRLIDLRESGNNVDIELYRAAAGAESPFLAIVGLRGVAGAQRTLDAQDRALLLRAVDSPYPSVRTAALQALGPDTWRDYHTRSVASAERKDSFLDDKDPIFAVKGVPVYAGARYRFFASGPTRAFYTTKDSPEQVLAFYTRGGKKAYSRDDLKALENPAQPTVDQQQQAMLAAANDPEKFQEQLMKIASLPAADWTRLDDLPGVVGARYVVLEKEEMIALGMMRATQVVVVFKDELLGATAIVVPPPLTAVVQR